MNGYGGERLPFLIDAASLSKGNEMVLDDGGCRDGLDTNLDVLLDKSTKTRFFGSGSSTTSKTAFFSRSERFLLSSNYDTQSNFSQQ